MPTISSYTSNLHLPQYLPTNYDSNLEFQVAAYNQSNYNRIFQTVRNLQSQALNIQMLNGEGRERLNQYNKMLSEKLSGDLGDLNKNEVQNEIANVFQTIAGDNELIKASSLSKDYQNQIDIIESYRASGRKDKGYNSINETVFKEWDGGLYDFMGSSLSKITSPTFQPVKYTPFKELDTKLLNIAKTLHANTFIGEGSSGTEGYLLHQEREDVSPERIRQMMMTQFDQEDLEQLDVMAKYEVIKNRKLGTIPDFHAKYNLYADNEIQRNRNQADVKRQQSEYYQSLINNSKTTDEKKAEYLQIVNSLNEQSKLYQNAATNLEDSKKSLSDFEKMSNEELLKYASEMQWNNKINGLSEALSWKKEVNTYKLDQAWKVNKELDAMRWREELRADVRLNIERIRDAQSTKDKESSLPQFSGPIDSVKNKQSFYDTYSTVVSESNRYGKLSDRIISAPFFKSSQLLDTVFLSSNKDNYEVKMWDIFSHENPTLAVKDGKPQIEAFKMWLANKEAHPEGIAEQYIIEQNNNKRVSDWLDMKISKINQATRKKVNLYDQLEGYPKYKSDGTPLTKAEYDKGVPAYIGVPDKEGYRLVNLDEALKEAESYTQSYAKYLESGQTIGGLPGMPISSKPTSYITQDRGLYENLLRLNHINKDVSLQLEQQMVDLLPQIFQQPLVEAVNEEAKRIYYPDVVSSAKNVNNATAQFGINIDDIAFIRPPVTGNKGQFQLNSKISEQYGELGWQLPDAEDPTKMIKIVPGGTYSFLTNKPVNPYNTLMNEIVKDIPIKENYKGYQIEISKSNITGNTYLIVRDNKGDKIDEASTNQVVDVDKALQASKMKIDIEVNKKK